MLTRSPSLPCPRSVAHASAAQTKGKLRDREKTLMALKHVNNSMDSQLTSQSNESSELREELKRKQNKLMRENHANKVEIDGLEKLVAEKEATVAELVAEVREAEKEVHALTDALEQNTTVHPRPPYSVALCSLRCQGKAGWGARSSPLLSAAQRVPKQRGQGGAGPPQLGGIIIFFFSPCTRPTPAHPHLRMPLPLLLRRRVCVRPTAPLARRDSRPQRPSALFPSHTADARSYAIRSPPPPRARAPPSTRVPAHQPSHKCFTSGILSVCSPLSPQLAENQKSSLVMELRSLEEQIRKKTQNSADLIRRCNMLTNDIAAGENREKQMTDRLEFAARVEGELNASLVETRNQIGQVEERLATKVKSNTKLTEEVLGTQADCKLIMGKIDSIEEQ